MYIETQNNIEHKHARSPNHWHKTGLGVLTSLLYDLMKTGIFIL